MNYRDFNAICQEALQEESPISTTSKSYGFIMPTGKIVKGSSHFTFHNELARQLGFKGEHAAGKAIKAGLVKFAVSNEGDASFQYHPTKQLNRYITKFIDKTVEIIGTVYIDIPDKHGSWKPTIEWPVDKALRFIPNLAI